MSNEFKIFNDNYNQSDFDRIKLDWNGEYGEKFHDPNYNFRINLSEYLVSQIEQANIELIHDLYGEITKSSKFTFTIYKNIHILGQELLRRDWKKYLIDYMRGGSYGIDSYLGTGRIEISKEIAIQILDYITEQKETTTNNDDKRLYNIFLQRFQWLVNRGQ